MSAWPVQDAKAHFSALVDKACSDGPQTITRHGADRAVVLSMEDYRALVALKPNFVSYLLGGPKVDDFAIERSSDPGRDIPF